MSASSPHEHISANPRVQSHFLGVNKLCMLPFNVRETFLSDHDDVIIADVDLHPGAGGIPLETQKYIQHHFFFSENGQQYKTDLETASLLTKMSFLAVLERFGQAQGGGELRPKARVWVCRDSSVSVAK